MTLLAGRWWKPDDLHSACFGHLELDEKSKDFLTLTLHGALSTERAADYPVIFGETASGEQLTLIECRRSGLRRGGSESGTLTSQERISCQQALRSGHVSEPTSAIWTEAECRFGNLDDWALRVPFTSDDEYGVDPDGGRWTTVRLTIPPPIEIAVGGAKLSISHEQNASEDSDSFSSARIARIGFKPDLPVELDDIDERFVTPMLYFLAFATDGTTPVERLHVAGPIVETYGNRQFPRHLEVIRPWSGRAVRKRHDFEMLLPLAVLGGDTDRVIAKWFELFASLRTALDLLFSVVFAEGLFLETRFLLFAQAAEVYHRHVFPGGVLDDGDHERRVNEVIAAAPAPHHVWLSGRLEHSNEPSLKQRLDELRRYSCLGPYGVLRPKFVREVADTRNYHTHYDPKLRRRAAKGESLYWLSEEIRALLTACLLRNLGFDEDRGWERLRGTRLAKALMHQGYPTS